MKQQMANVCLYHLKPRLSVPAVGHWIPWARQWFYTERTGEPDNAVALSPEVNAVCECPQTGAHTHSRENALLVHVIPQK